MRTKRIFIMLLVVVLTAICCATTVSAASANSLKLAVEVSSSTALVQQPCAVKPGDSVEVAVSITENTGLKGVFTFDVLYDAEALELAEKADGTVDFTTYKLLGGNSAENVVNSVNGKEGVASYMTYGIDNSIKPTGKLVTLKFTVKDTFNGEISITLGNLDYNVIFADGTFGSATNVDVKDSEDKDYEGATIQAHAYGAPQVTAPNCTDAGKTVYSCTKCDYKIEIAGDPALNHDLSDPATCTTAQKCKREGCTYVAQEALNHKDTIVIDAAKEATCTSTGLTEGSHCSACNAVIVAQEEIAIKDHNYSDWTVEKEAAEGVKGLKSKTCSACGDKVTEDIPALPVPEPEPEPKSNTGLIVLIIVLVVVVLGAGGFCLYWFVLRKKKTA